MLQMEAMVMAVIVFFLDSGFWLWKERLINCLDTRDDVLMVFLGSWVTVNGNM